MKLVNANVKSVSIDPNSHKTIMDGIRNIGCLTLNLNIDNHIIKVSQNKELLINKALTASKLSIIDSNKKRWFI